MRTEQEIKDRIAALEIARKKFQKEFDKYERKQIEYKFHPDPSKNPFKEGLDTCDDKIGLLRWVLNEKPKPAKKKKNV